MEWEVGAAWEHTESMGYAENMAGVEPAGYMVHMAGPAAEQGLEVEELYEQVEADDEPKLQLDRSHNLRMGSRVETLDLHWRLLPRWPDSIAVVLPLLQRSTSSTHHNAELEPEEDVREELAAERRSSLLDAWTWQRSSFSCRSATNLTSAISLNNLLIKARILSHI